jgi:hypothetical protein
VDGTSGFACCRGTINTNAAAFSFQTGASGPYTLNKLRVAFMCSYGATCPSTFSVTVSLMTTDGTAARKPSTALATATVTAGLGASGVNVFTTFTAADLGSVGSASLTASTWYSIAFSGASSGDYTIPNTASTGTYSTSGGFTAPGNYYYTTNGGTGGYWYQSSGALLVSIGP